jgi:hypothetical protein
MASGRYYVRTQAGKAALRERETHPESLRGRLGRFSEEDTRALLDELVERGLVQVVEASADNKLDYSGNLADFLPQQR